MLAMAGQDIDQFMKEMEVVHKKRETERAQDLNARLSLLDGDSVNEDQNDKRTADVPPMPAPQPPMPLMGLPPPPPLMYRPPPPPLHLRIPPPPPPRMGIRLPPGKKNISTEIIQIYATRYFFVALIIRIRIIA